MDTLKSIRRGEVIRELTREVLNNVIDTAYVVTEIDDRTQQEILVVAKHSDDVVDRVLSKINPADSGYIFFASELDVDPLKNCMVPEHRIATTEEIDGILDRRVPLDMLPILRMLDPVRRWHNFPQGSIVAIDRQGGSVYFRRVV